MRTTPPNPGGPFGPEEPNIASVEVNRVMGSFVQASTRQLGSARQRFTKRSIPRHPSESQIWALVACQLAM